LSTTPECQDLTARRHVTGYVAGSLAAEETREFETHLITCEWCQEEVRLAAAIRADLESVSSSAQRPSRVRRFIAAGGVVAAAAAIVLLVRAPESPVGEGRDSDHRAEIEASAVPEPLSPVGAVDAVDEIRWRGTPEAGGYRLTLVDSDGAMLWEVETADTFTVFPEAVQLERGPSYFWKVEARTGMERWVGSEFVPFNLTASPDSSR